MTMAIQSTGRRGKAIGSLLGLAGILAATAVLAPAATAQEPQTVLETVEDVYERRSGNYFRHRSLFGQIDFLTGFGGFAEQRINKDAAALEGAYDELMMLQTQNTATVRTPDLPNPYTTSVQLLPASQFDSRVIGSELNFEPLPRR